MRNICLIFILPLLACKPTFSGSETAAVLSSDHKNAFALLPIHPRESKTNRLEYSLVQCSGDQGPELMRYLELVVARFPDSLYSVGRTLVDKNGTLISFGKESISAHCAILDGAAKVDASKFMRLFLAGKDYFQLQQTLWLAARGPYKKGEQRFTSAFELFLARGGLIPTQDTEKIISRMDQSYNPCAAKVQNSFYNCTSPDKHGYSDYEGESNSPADYIAVFSKVKELDVGSQLSANDRKELEAKFGVRLIGATQHNQTAGFQLYTATTSGSIYDDSDGRFERSVQQKYTADLAPAWESYFGSSGKSTAFQKDERSPSISTSNLEPDPYKEMQKSWERPWNEKMSEDFRKWEDEERTKQWEKHLNNCIGVGPFRNAMNCNPSSLPPIAEPKDPPHQYDPNNGVSGELDRLNELEPPKEEPPVQDAEKKSKEAQCQKLGGSFAADGYCHCPQTGPDGRAVRVVPSGREGACEEKRQAMHDPLKAPDANTRALMRLAKACQSLGANHYVESPNLDSIICKCPDGTQRRSDGTAVHAGGPSGHCMEERSGARRDPGPDGNELLRCRRRGGVLEQIGNGRYECRCKPPLYMDKNRQRCVAADVNQWAEPERRDYRRRPSVWERLPDIGMPDLPEFRGPGQMFRDWWEDNIQFSR